MRGLRVGATVMILGSVAMMGCGDDDDGESGGGTVYTDPATPIEVSVGDEFTIQLESTPGTGYSWELAEPPNASVVSAEGSDFQPRDDDRPGAPGDQQLSFRAVGAGDATIALRYVRPWEEGVAPARTEDFAVTVT